MVFGDFNHMKDKYFKNSTQFSQIVKFPTHGLSTIDLCYTSLKSYYNEPLHLPGIGLCKHHTLIFSPCFNYENKPNTYIIEKRNESITNKINLCKAIEAVSWEPLYRANTCKDKFDLFSNIITKLIEEHLPIQTVKRNSNDLPWVTDKFRNLIKRRQKYFNTGNLIREIHYRVLPKKRLWVMLVNCVT